MALVYNIDKTAVNGITTRIFIYHVLIHVLVSMLEQPPPTISIRNITLKLAFLLYYDTCFDRQALFHQVVKLPCVSPLCPPFPRPPSLPPKPQKMRKPRPRSMYNHRLFNGNMESFIQVSGLVVML